MILTCKVVSTGSPAKLEFSPLDVAFAFIQKEGQELCVLSLAGVEDSFLVPLTFVELEDLVRDAREQDSILRH